MRIGAIFVFCIALFTSFTGCREQAPVVSPPGYDLSEPKKFVVGEILHEISGVVFYKGNPDTLYAIEDEAGRLFYLHLGERQYPYWKFGKRGDYEDVTILDDKEFVVLRSDGSLFVFPIDQVRKGGDEGASTKSYEHILPSGEYEGLYADGGKLIALCKNCPEDDKRDEVSAYVLQYNANHELAITDHILVQVKVSKRFHPSALARHPKTGEWYVLSSVNKALIVLDEQWKYKKTYELDPILFKQPEGLAFDKDGNMYVSNEGHGGTANVLVFSYKP
ncbi:MAG: SdiA-regulated domain-containing protein [Bacteroidetes bacterium]|nr:SdiA-regulated domain-containing protein [Bacteroidota bacterium]